jgi:hypothetical protein
MMSIKLEAAQIDKMHKIHAPIFRCFFVLRSAKCSRYAYEAQHVIKHIKNGEPNL